MHALCALDRRRHPRRDASLVVSYCAEDARADYELTQTRNISQGGMLLLTARAVEPRVRLAMKARLCLEGTPRLARGMAEAVESRELVRDLLYETRVRFIDPDRRSFRIIGDFCATADEPF